jgi:hypothetical protein
LVPVLPVQNSPENGLAESLQLLQQAVSLVHSWSDLPFLALTGPNTTLEQVLQSPTEHHVVVVAVLGQQLPPRRNLSLGQPFLSVSSDDSAMLNALSLLPVSAINDAASRLEAHLGRQKPMYTFRLEVCPTQWDGGLPAAIWDVSSGSICLSIKAISLLQEGTAQLGDKLHSFVASLFGADLPQGDLNILLQTLTAAAAAAATLALSSQVPLWFCIGCPVVLGMLAPFVFNFGLGAIAQQLCDHYQLPTDECNELWYGVFALAMVLSFASVIPIVSLCKLRQCAKPS